MKGSAFQGALLVSIVAVLVSSSVANGLNEPSHELINAQAVGSSSLNQLLRDHLGVSEGVDRLLRARNETHSVLRWIELGGTREDLGTFGEMVTGKARFFRHFHDPLRPWDNSGLFFPLGLPPRFTRFESSVRWAQQENQDSVTGHGNFSWLDARRYFKMALTDPDATVREQAFADTFRALGQVMHLVVDVSVPEHARSDVHPMGAVLDQLGAVGNYEYWVLAQHRHSGTQPGFIRDFLSTPTDLDEELLRITIPGSESVARVPIARLFDSDRYTGDNPEVTAESRIGIAEIANANFFSEDTHRGEYPHPALANLETFTRIYSQNGKERTYYRKRVAGLAVEPIAAECALADPTQTVSLCPDEDVWRETARHMLPRAVRYSRALLDYFFRGTLDFTIGGSSPNQTLTITNKSGEAMDGTFTLYADNFSQARSAVKSFDLSLAPQATSAALTFTPPAEVQAYTLVFQGRLGNEEGAVAGKVKQIPLNAFFVWHVRLYNDQFDLVHRGSGFTGACFFPFVRSIISSGTHSGQRKDYLFFAFVNDANLPVSPLDLANLQLTTRVSPSESIIPHFGIRYLPFSGSALGIIQPAGNVGCSPTVTFSYAPVVTGLFPASQADPSFLAKPTPPPNHYVYLADNDSLLHDTGVAASADILVTKKLTPLSLQQMGQIARDLHPLLVPPDSFSKSGALYAFAEFDIPNIDSWNLEFSTNPDDLANQKLAWGGTTPIASISVAESWDLHNPTLLVSGEAEINISVPHQRIRRLDLQAVYGTQYQITLQRGLESLTLRHNPNDPFTPITKSLP